MLEDKISRKLRIIALDPQVSDRAIKCLLREENKGQEKQIEVISLVDSTLYLLGPA